MSGRRHHWLEANHVVGNLWQGSRPPVGDYRMFESFDIVVLCAQEYQPSARELRVSHVIHIPFDDSYDVSVRQLTDILRKTIRVRAALDLGKKVLVTCQAGLNRSGLVSAWSLMRPATHIRRVEVRTPCCVPLPNTLRMIRRARGQHALSNDHFVRALLDTERSFQAYCGGDLPRGVRMR